MRAASAGEELARLAALMVGTQNQIRQLETLVHDGLENLSQLTDAKFVMYGTLITSQAEKVALALDATEKAIGKAEIATGKAIDKESLANSDRFKSVNEFRAQQTELIARFATLERVDLLFQQLTRQIGESNKNTSERMDRFEEILKTVQIWQGNITGRLAVGGIIFIVLMAIITFIANYATRK